MRYEKEHGGVGVGGNVKYPRVYAQEGKKLSYFLFVLRSSELGEVVCLLGLLAPTACSNTVLIINDPWTPQSQSIPRSQQ